jgi:HEAT repeat protein
MSAPTSWISRVLLFAAVTSFASAQQSSTPPSARPSSVGAASEQAVKPEPAKSTKERESTAWAMLTRAAASEKSRDRSDAISAISLLDKDPKAISLIETALDDKDANIRFLAASTLGAMDARAAIPKLRDAMYDDSPQVSFAAVQSLWKMGDRSGRDLLYEILDGERKTKQGVIKTKMDQAKQTMHDPKAMALIGINQASGAFLGPFSMGISFIEEYAKNNSAPVQALCAQMLSSDNDSMTVEELNDALGDKNWAVRSAAARALAKLNHRPSIPKLEDMMENEKEQQLARFSAAAAIIDLDEHGARVPAPAPPKTGERSGK